MARILWIMNKYVGAEKSEEFYPYFLSHVQEELKKRGHELLFIFFSDLLASNKLIENKVVFDPKESDGFSKEFYKKAAERIERDYEFTFKQAYFADILQTSKSQTGRKIGVPERDFSDLSFLIPRFLFLEKTILSRNIDVIFSDVSPEAEMEFGRVIGNKLNKIVFKAYEGSALGNTVILQLLDFGKDKWIQVKGDQNWSEEKIKSFCEDFKKNKRNPYKPYSTLLPNEKLVKKIVHSLIRKEIQKTPLKLVRQIKRLPRLFFIKTEKNILKPLYYNKYDPNVPNLFMGFHLNQESTMALRAQPYTNQVALIEMISRVLPFNYILYVREHPHWPDRFPIHYLRRLQKLPNVRLISPKISIHDILRHTSGVLTYNATTGIEALLYDKPVLSFASNLYYEYHSGVDQCIDLYELGKKLSQLVNRKIDKNETLEYIYKLKSYSISFGLGSYNFSDAGDSMNKAKIFSKFLEDSIHKSKEDGTKK